MIFDEDSEFVLEALDDEGDAPIAAFDALAETAQLLSSAGGNWTLHVVDGTGRTGVVGIARGHVIYARVGRALGREAFREMMTWSNGEIVSQTTQEQPEDMREQVGSLLLDAYWHAADSETSEVTHVQQTIDHGERVEGARAPLSPQMRSRLAELAAVEGFTFVCAWADGEVAMYMWDPDVRRTEAVLERARSLHEYFLESLELLSVDDWEHAVLQLGSEVHVAGVVDDEGRRVSVHAVLERRRVNIAMALYRVRQILEG